MATGTLALDSANTYPFRGYGVSSPLYEKDWPLRNNLSVQKTNTLFDQFVTDVMQHFAWLRIHVLGGEHYNENAAGTRNYPARRQAELLARLNRLGGPYRYIITPYSAPSSCQVTSGPYNGDGVGHQRSVRANWTDIPKTATAADVRAAQAFLGTAPAWQAWRDALIAEMDGLVQRGCQLDLFTTPNEISLGAIAIHWNTALTEAQVVDYINKIWLGTGLTGGGIKSRYPWMKFDLDETWFSPSEATLNTLLNADATAKAEVTYWGRHFYPSTGVMGTLPIVAPFNGIVTELGSTSGDAMYNLGRCLHSAVVYNRAPIVCLWASLRDTAKGNNTPQLQNYTALGIGSYDEWRNLITLRNYWWATKPYLLASGKVPDTTQAGHPVAKAWCAASGTSPGGANAAGADANFDLANGALITHFKRYSDGKHCTVVFNASGGARTDTVAFTLGGSAFDLTGNSYLFDFVAGTQGSATPVSTTSGALATSLANDQALLIEWAYTA